MKQLDGFDGYEGEMLDYIKSDGFLRKQFDLC